MADRLLRSAPDIQRSNLVPLLALLEAAAWPSGGQCRGIGARGMFLTRLGAETPA